MAQGDASYHYTLMDPELFKDGSMISKLRKVLFKGPMVEKDVGHDPTGTGLPCYVYNYVSHL
jgi:hypothetical protein